MDPLNKYIIQYRMAVAADARRDVFEDSLNENNGMQNQIASSLSRLLLQLAMSLLMTCEPAWHSLYPI